MNILIKIKTSILITCFILFTNALFAQLTGVKTIDPAGSGLDNYTSFSAAITDLNTNGVGVGGVTFNVAAGATFNEIVDLVITTNTSNATNPIVFQKSGIGANPIIFPNSGQISTGVFGTYGDFVIKVVSTDHITFDGLDLRSNPLATNNASVSEYGIYLVKTPTDACKNIIIQNCNFNLNKSLSSFTIGIYQSNLNDMGTEVVVTSDEGRSENNVYVNNTFENTYHGVYLKGYSHTVSPYNLLDNNNRVAGNSITNFGGGSVTCYGISSINQDSLTVRENTVTGGSGNTTTLYGIYNTGGTNTTLSYHKNTVSLSSIGISTYYGIYVTGSTLGATPNNIINVDSNTVQNCIFSSTSPLYGIYIITPSKYLNVRGNKISGNSTNGTVYNFYITTNNTVTNLILANNRIENHNRLLSTMTGTFYGMYISSYKNGLIYNNTIRRIFNKAGNTGSIYGYYDFAGALNLTAYNNTIDSIYSRGSANVYGMYFSNTSITNKLIYDNKISRIYSQGGSVIYGMYTSSGDTSFIYRNSISDLELDSARGITMVGMYFASGAGITAYSNSISDLKSLNSWTSSTTAIRGAYITSTNCNFYNNTIVFAASSTTTNAAGFATAAIEASTTPIGLDFRNNIFINKSANVLPGKTVGLRLQSTTLTAINTLQNNNIYYTTTSPSSSTPLFYDGTNVDTTINAFKGRFAPAESNSVMEDVPFVSTTTPYDVHINPNIPTRVESRASLIPQVNTDIDGITRNSVTPDIGADEGSFLPMSIDVYPPVISNVSISPTGTGACNAVPHVITATITDASGVAYSNILWKKDEVSQTPISMTRGASNVWSGIIPAQYETKKSIQVSWNLSAVDSASIPNFATYLGTTYKDAALYINAGYTGLDTINIGQTVQLNAKATPALVNTGTNNTGNNTIYTPFYRGWGGTKRQFLYRGSELAAAGLPVGGITSLAFDVVTPASGLFTAMPGFTVYIDSTSATTAGSTFITSNNAVFGPVSYTATSGINNFSFANPFVWNGTSNIVVTVCWSDGTVGGGLTYYVKNSTTAYAASTYSNQDSQTPATLCGTTSGSTANGRADILFGYNPPRTYAWTSTPSGILSSTNTLNTSATIATPGNYQLIVSVNDSNCTNTDTVSFVAVVPQKPVPNFTASSTTANIGGAPSTVTFTDQSTNVPDSYQWSFTPNTVTYVGGTNSTSINPQVQFTGKGPYTVSLKVTNAAGSDSLVKTAFINTIKVYCSSNATSSIYDDIGNVTINDFVTGNILLNNGIDTPFVNRVYNTKLYTNWVDSSSVVIPTLYKGDKYNLIIGRTWTTSNKYTTHATAYIDYNDNGSFADAGEMIDIGLFTPTLNNNRTNTLFTIPCSVDTGIHTMRIVLIGTSSAIPSSSCGTYTYGETEDYNVRIMPSQLTLDSLVSEQNDLTDVQPNTTNNVVALIKVAARGCNGVLPVTSFNISTTGTTNLVDITSAKLWYTGSSPVFATAQQYGSTLTAAATLNFTGSTPLLADTNYFWLTYDIAASATLTNFIDATVNTVTVGGVATVPSVTSPVGSRKINFPVSLVSNTTIQNSNTILQNSNDQVVLKGILKMTSGGSSVNMSQVKVALTGSTRKADIKNVKVWFTGSNRSFNPITATQFDSTRTLLSDTMTFVGTASVGTDTNYVWLTYSIKDTAKINNIVDGEFLSYSINNLLSVPTITNPTGYRKIVDFTIPDTIKVNVLEDTLLVPKSVKVSLGTVINKINGIGAYQFKFNFDSNRFRLDSISKNNTDSRVGALIYNMITPNRISIAWTSTQNILGNSPLLNLYFTAIDSGKSEFNVSDVLFDTSFVIISNSKSVVNKYNFGDVDINSIIQAYDGMLALRYSVGLDPLPTIDPLPWEPWRVKIASVDTSRFVTANDASLILKYVVGLISQFPKRGVVASPGYVITEIENNEIVVRAYGNLGGLNIDFLDHQSSLSAPSYVYSTDALTEVNNQAGNYKVGMAFTESPSNGTVILRIPFQLNSNETINLSIMENTNYRNAQLNVTTGMYTSVKSNVKFYPNPTMDKINIDGLTENKTYTLQVFDILGKLIETKSIENKGELDLSNYNVGVYVVKIDNIIYRILKQ